MLRGKPRMALDLLYDPLRFFNASSDSLNVDFLLSCSIAPARAT